MNAPFTPADFRTLIISPTATFCLAFVKLFIRLPLLVSKLADFFWNADGSINEDGFLRQVFNPGDLKFSAASAAPVGFKLCDGSALLRADYPELYAAIGTIYGVGDASTTFNIPDYSGRFPIGVGQTQGLLDSVGDPVAGETYALGNKGGDQGVVLLMENLPSEPAPLGAKCDALFMRRTANVADDGAATDIAGGGNVNERNRENAHEDHADNVMGDLGTDVPHDNIPPFCACFIYIKI